MKLYAKFGRLEIVTAQQNLASMHKKRIKIEMMPEKDIPRFTSKKHLIAYQTFAEGCAFYNLNNIDYLDLRRLEAYVSGSNWTFRYKIKKGLFFCDYCEFEYDEDWELKLKEQERKDKEELRRRRKILRG